MHEKENLMRKNVTSGRKKYAVHVMKCKSLYEERGYVYKVDNYFNVDLRVMIL